LVVSVPDFGAVDVISGGTMLKSDLPIALTVNGGPSYWRRPIKEFEDSTGITRSENGMSRLLTYAPVRWTLNDRRI
jgi:hypothetical protein